MVHLGVCVKASAKILLNSCPPGAPSYCPQTRNLNVIFNLITLLQSQVLQCDNIPDLLLKFLCPEDNSFQ